MLGTQIRVRTKKGPKGVDVDCVTEFDLMDFLHIESW